MKKLCYLAVLFLFISCGTTKSPIFIADQWIGKSEKDIKRLSKQDFVKIDDYYRHIQRLEIPYEKEKKVKDKKTGQVSYLPPSASVNYEVETRYYISEGKVSKWEIIYHSIQ